MTTETTKQADGAPTGAAGGSAAGTGDLDSLLSEFGAAGKTDKSPTADVLKQLAPVITFAQDELANRQAEGLKKDLQSAIGFVKEDEAIKDIPDKLVRGMLEAYAADNESFAQAFANRAKDQKAWQAKLAEARTSLSGEFKTLNGTNTVSSDVLAARAAVTGAVSQPSGDQKHDAAALFAMSDQDYQKVIAAEAAKARR